MPNMYKKYFPVYINNPQLIYLDSSATALKPLSVISAISDYYTNYSANVHRGLYPLSQIATQKYEESRADVANFIHAFSPAEVVWTKSTTESLNLLAYSLADRISQDSEIILKQKAHHANLLPWQRLANSKNAVIKYIPIDPQTYRLDTNNISQLITSQTRIVTLDHVSNVTGAITDTVNLINQIKQINPEILVIVDGAQAICHLSVDVQSLGCDFYTFSGHKLFGPTGIGVLWGKEDLLNNMPPFLVGGNMISQVDYNQATFVQSPARLEAGTQPVAQVIGLAQACKFINSINKTDIFNYLKNIAKYTIDQLNTIPQLKIIGPNDTKDRVGVISFTLDNIHPHDIAQYLGDRNICIRAGHHCTMPLHTLLSIPASARISLQIYNTQQDIDITIATLKDMIKLFNK